MAADVIISYDGTPNDDDAVALGRQLAEAGLSLALAYVRHAREFDPGREELAAHDANERLERGAKLLDDPGIGRHVVFGASTPTGLQQLAAEQEASLIVFGSDYRTAPGAVEPGATAQRLLEGGSVGVAIASAGLRTQWEGRIRSIAVPLAGPTNDVARQTARDLAERLGARIAESRSEPVDLIVVGSAPGAAPGRIAVGGEVRTELNGARSSVMVLPAGAQILP